MPNHIEFYILAGVIVFATILLWFSSREPLPEVKRGNEATLEVARKLASEHSYIFGNGITREELDALAKSGIKPNQLLAEVRRRVGGMDIGSV